MPRSHPAFVPRCFPAVAGHKKLPEFIALRGRFSPVLTADSPLPGLLEGMHRLCASAGTAGNQPFAATGFSAIFR